MTRFFINLLGISAATSVAILVLLLLRHRLQQRYAAKWSCLLWLVIALRLALPFTLPAAKAPVVVSVPYTETTLMQSHTVSTNTQLDIVQGDASSPILSPSAPAQVVTTEPAAPSPFSAITLGDAAASIWLAGAGIYALLQLIRNLTFRRSLRRWSQSSRNPEIGVLAQSIAAELSLSQRVEVVVCHAVTSPMLVGLIRPQLILPHEDYNEQELSFILRHELTHCKEKHLWFKLLLVIANTLHWFNPLVYRMVREAEADLERACDDRVVQEATLQSRKAYSTVILKGIDGQTARAHHLSTQFYCTKDELKSRFRNIFDSGKKRSGRVILLLTVCVLLVCGMVACSADAGDAPSPTDIVEETIAPESPIATEIPAETEVPAEIESPTETELPLETEAPTEADTASTPEEELTRLFLTLFHTSNWEGRWDTFQETYKGSTVAGTEAVSISEAGTEALIQYYAGIQPFCTENGYNGIALNNHMMWYDALAAENQCTFSPSKISLSPQGKDHLVWSYTVEIAVVHQDEPLCTLVSNGQLILVREDGQLLVDDLWINSLGAIKTYLTEKLQEVSNAETPADSSLQASDSAAVDANERNPEAELPT